MAQEGVNFLNPSRPPFLKGGTIKTEVHASVFIYMLLKLDHQIRQHARQ